MELSLKYLFIPVSALELASIFYREVLGFTEMESMPGLNDRHMVVNVNGSGPNMVLLEGEKEITSPRLVLCSNDCLRDYLRLKSSGVKFTKEPCYGDGGLAAEFIDPFDNPFTLLEERIYEHKK